MSYTLTLIKADVPEPLLGEVSLALNHKGSPAASIELSWSKKQFTGRFNGFAPDMPEPAHPMAFVKAAVDAVNAAKVMPDEPLSSVFGRGALPITI